MKICVGTKNQKKLETTQHVWEQILGTSADFVGYDAPSGVAEAPIDDDVIHGAENRAKACHDHGDYDYSIGIESGLVHRYGDVFEEAWVVVLDANDNSYKAYSSGLMLPPAVTQDMQQGQLHNEVMAMHDRRLNLPDDNRDTWSRYSGGQISRVRSFEEALRNVLVQIADVDNSLYKL